MCVFLYATIFTRNINGNVTRKIVIENCKRKMAVEHRRTTIQTPKLYLREMQHFFRIRGQFSVVIYILCVY